MSEEQFAPGFAKQVFEQNTSTNSMRSKGLPRKMATFVMDHTECGPGVFPQDFKVTLRSLSSRDEMKAAKAAKSDPASLGFEMAKASLYKINGDLLGHAEKEFFWDAFDNGGRQLVMYAFQKIAGAREESVGKVLESLEVTAE